MAGPTLSRALDLTGPDVPKCSLNVQVPWPIDERLTRLVDLVAAEKLGPTSKWELAAALIQTAPEDGLALWDKALALRRATVGQATFWLPDDVDPVTFTERKRGRRPS
jgi:hypothetical protein